MSLQQLNCSGNYYRKINAVINVILVLHQLFILCSEAYYLDNNPYRHKQILGPKGSFVVEWTVNFKEKSVIFQVSAETKGWIGFGLSKDGRMLYSDAIIGGVDSYSGKPYFNDIHINGNRSVHIDEKQNWRLIGAWEKQKRTYLSFSRMMETCDPQDLPVTKDLISLIWAYGETDEVQYHYKHRGSAPVYLLDPAISDELAHDHYRQIGPHSNLYLVQRWAVTNTLRLSSRPASVWCSVQTAPRLRRRHDIVGMGAFLPTKLAKQHVHKMLLYKCTSPQQTEAETFFGPYARMQGEECFLNDKRSLPLAFCRELIYVWGKGGKPFYFPEDIGIPIGLSQNEYYLLETHFDNPSGKATLNIEAGIEVIYSHREKAQNASLLQIGYGPLGTFMVPPRTTISIYGNCGPKCTSTMFPKNGANIFAVMLHSRSLGRSIRLRHFNSGSTELPWILKDENYDSEYQQMRLLNKQVTILPGDQLTTEWMFDSRGRNRTSFSGFSSQDEVCAAFVYVSRQMPYFRCTSELPADRLLSKYGIHNFTWDLSWQDRYVTAPKHLEGTWLGDVVDDKFQVNKADFHEMQHDFKYGAHLQSCPNIYDMMGYTQNQLFRTFTNNWQRDHEAPLVATRTPHTTSTVIFPKEVNEYTEDSFCGSSPNQIPYKLDNIMHNNLIQSTEIAHLPNRGDPKFSGVPPPAQPPNPPAQHPGFSTLFSINEPLRSNNNNPSSSKTNIRIPTPAYTHPAATKAHGQDPPVIRNSIPRPRLPPSPPSNTFVNAIIENPLTIETPPSQSHPKAQTNFDNLTNRRPNPPSMEKWTPIVPRPAPPPQPPAISSPFISGPSVSSIDDFSIPTAIKRPSISSLNKFLTGGGNDINFPSSVPTRLNIPMFQANKQPDLSNDKSIMNLFEQIANIFSSTPNSRGNGKDSFSFQHQISMNNNNFLKRKNA